jgi:small conductance mechanosensitive channel
MGPWGPLAALATHWQAGPKIAILNTVMPSHPLCGGCMHIDLSNAWKSGSRIIDTTVSLLPNLILAVIVFVLFVILASAAKSVVRRFIEKRRRRRSLGLLLGQLTHTLVVILGFLIALSIVAPSFQASDLIKVLGIGSVAVGFAFQNILQNFLAGILLLLQEPFEIGDWISVTGLEGTVDDIQTRATIITTKDQQRVVIPNAVLFTSPVIVGRQQPQQATAQVPTGATA